MSRRVFLVIVVSLTAAGAWAGGPSTFDAVMDHYEPIRKALMNDSMDGVSAHGTAIAGELRALESEFSPARTGATGEAVDVVREKLPEMISAADAIAAAKSLEAARDGLYDLSKPMVRWREGVVESDLPAVAYCPMHRRSWLQSNGDLEIGNPYGGMPRCGEIVSR